MRQSNTWDIKVFISYAHEDEALRKELDKHLSLLKRHKIIDVWYDRDISAGMEWEQQIDSHLNTAQVILLLVSSDFLASEYSYSVEVKRAMQRHEAGEARVIPVILRPVLWHWAPFGELQALPTDAEPVISKSWNTQDDAFLDVAKGIEKAVFEVIGSLLLAKRFVAMGETNFEAKQYEKAMEDYNHAVQLAPKYFEAYLARGGAYFKLKDYRKAIADFDRALQLNPNEVGLYYVRGTIYNALGEFQKAIADFDRALEINPKDIESSITRGHTYFHLKEYQKAIISYAHTIQLAPTRTEAYLYRGLAYYHLQERQKAITDFDRALEIDPENIQTYYARADLYALSEDYQKAITDYDRILALNPNHAGAKRGRENAFRSLRKNDA